MLTMRKTKRRNRWIALALVLCLLVGLLPTTALAEDGPETDVGLDFTSVTKNWQSADGSVVWEYHSNGSNLTLNNANLRGADMSSNDSYALRLPADTEVYLRGTNIVTGGTAGNGFSYGIYSDGNLSIQGDGVLHATSGTASASSAGLCAEDSVIIKEAAVTTTGGTCDAGNSRGISAGENVDISESATVTATGGTCGVGDSYGVYADGDILLNGGLVIARSGAALTSQAMNRNVKPELLNHVMADLLDPDHKESYEKNFAVYGAEDTYKVQKTALDPASLGTDPGSLEADGYAWDSESNTLTLKNLILVPGGNNGNNVALSLPGGATIKLAGTNVIRSADATGNFSSRGIVSALSALDASITGESDDGRLFAMGGTTVNGSSVGIFVPNSIEISGGTVTAMGGTSAAGYSTGLGESDTMIISGGMVTAIGGTAGASSAGISATSNMTISGGTVTAIGGTANKNSIGIDGNDLIVSHIMISGGTVTAVGGTANHSMGMSTRAISISKDAVVTATSGPASYTSNGINTLMGDIIISGGTVTAAGGKGDDSHGILTTGTFTITGGRVTAAGNTRALYSAPNLSGYARAVATASVNLSGSQAEPYEASKNDDYKHFHVEQAPPPPPPVNWYTVSASAGKGGSVEPEGEISVRSGDSREFVFTEEPGFWLAALLVDEKALGTEGSSFTFSNVKEDHTLRGLFLPFEDMNAKSWFAPDVAALYDLDVLLGETETRFAPKNTMTREMLVTTLYRAAGEPELPENLGYPFEDVDAQSYYANAVYWAREAGIVYGVDSEHFGVGRNITRQDLACMLYRYASYLEQDVTGRGDLSAFTDGDRISGYAQEAVSWAVYSGVLVGKGNQILDPRGSATRAEAAAMLNRFLNLK